MHFVHFLVVFLYLSHMCDVSSGAETTAWLEKFYIEQLLCWVVLSPQLSVVVLFQLKLKDFSQILFQRLFLLFPKHLIICIFSHL